MARTTAARRNDICSMLTQNCKIRVDELSKHFDVSEVTIRKDLRYLEENGKVFRGHGTAQSLGQIASVPLATMNDVLHERMELNAEEKDRIANVANDMVNDWDVVLLAPGSTCCTLAKKLAKRPNVIIVTNAVNFTSELTDVEARLIYLGGEYNIRSGATTGTFVIDALNSINIDKFFLGANGVIADKGVTSYDFDGMLSQMMINRSKEVILVADHTKFGRANALTVVDIKNIDTVITGSELAAEFQEDLQKNVRNLILT